MRLTCAIALSTAILLSAHSVAFARGEINIKPPVNDGQGPVVVIDRPQPDKPDNTPYDEGVDTGETDPEKTPHDAHPMICQLDRLITDGEHVHVWFVNKGDTILPKGTWIVVTYPDGTKEKYQLPVDVHPHGGAWGFWLPDGVWDFKGDFDCSVHVTSA